jgi:hypothetical protein
MNVIFSVKVELTAYITAKKVTRKSDFWGVAAPNIEAITIELLNEPQNLNRFIPNFILGKTREMYKVSKIIEIIGPLGNNKEVK